MQALTFWKTVTNDKTDFLERLLELLDHQRVHYCVSGGQAVNAYVEPVVTLDLDLVIAPRDLPRARALLQEAFRVQEFPHSLNVSSPGSDLRVQIQTDPRYESFPERTEEREVLGLAMPVASLEDVLQGKVWAVQDPARRGSKRQKDLADIARILETYPELRERVPAEVLRRLL